MKLQRVLILFFLLNTTFSYSFSPIYFKKRAHCEVSHERDEEEYEKNEIENSFDITITFSDRIKIAYRALAKTIVLYNVALMVQYTLGPKTDFQQIPFKEFLSLPLIATALPLFFSSSGLQEGLLNHIVNFFEHYEIKGRYEPWLPCDQGIDPDAFFQLYNSDPEHYRINVQARHFEYLNPENIWAQLSEQEEKLQGYFPPSLGLRKLLITQYTKNHYSIFIIIFSACMLYEIHQLMEAKKNDLLAAAPNNL